MCLARSGVARIGTMRPGPGIGALVALVTLGCTLGSPTVARASQVREFRRAVLRGARSDRPDQRHGTSTPSPVTHRPDRPGPAAIAARRDDRLKRLPESPATLAASRHAFRNRRHALATIRDWHLPAPAGVFHDANAPPGPLAIVASRYV